MLFNQRKEVVLRVVHVVLLSKERSCLLVRVRGLLLIL